MSFMEIEEVSNCEALPLLSLNHVSILCRSVWASVRFYEEVLGFVLIKRPSSFKFNGAWLYNYGIGIHLLENPSIMDEYDTINELRPINPKDNHISFQCTDVGLVKRRLQEMGMRYVTAVVEDDGAKVDQVFFHDPDGYMVELCNCENIPIIPLASCPVFKPTSTTTFKKPGPITGPITGPMAKCGFMENVMMESLSMDMLNFSF
ncbi:glyoxylase I 4-like [Humulus lupulus]|uniref:glyoxylase I 4-like n=1 Tax=Humulus lupulus TaxID=3486 RepID=UPI002B411B0E|nr:glyoxylase I 4-like [Humulus lupulus]